MSLEIKIMIDATPQLLAVLTALTGGGGSTAPSSNGAAVKQMPAKNAPAAAPAPAAQAANSSADTGIKLEDLRALVKATADQSADKKTAVKNLLAEYGVKSVSTLPAEQYSEFHEKVKAI